MPPRAFTLPPASTASAKAARSAFFCSLCQKGYSRQNQFDAHESSYDHQHKKRLKEMKEMQRQVKGGIDENRGKGRDGDGIGGGLVTIKLGKGEKVGGEEKEGFGKKGAGGGGGGGFKNGGFRNAFAPMGGDGDGDLGGGVEEKGKEVRGEEVKVNMKMKVEDEDSDVTDEEDYYDPRRPTGCMPGCPGLIGG